MSSGRAQGRGLVDSTRPVDGTKKLGIHAQALKDAIRSRERRVRSRSVSGGVGGGGNKSAHDTSPLGQALENATRSRVRRARALTPHREESFLRRLRDAASESRGDEVDGRSTEVRARSLVVVEDLRNSHNQGSRATEILDLRGADSSSAESSHGILSVNLARPLEQDELRSRRAGRAFAPALPMIPIGHEQEAFRTFPRQPPYRQLEFLLTRSVVPNPVAGYVSEVLRMRGSDFDRAQSELQVSREQLNWLVSEEVENPRSQFVREEVLSKDQLKRIEANLDLSLSAEQVSRLLRIGREDPAVGYLTSNLIGPRQSRALRLGEDVVVPTKALAPLLSPRLQNPNAKYVTELLGVQEVARLISSPKPAVLAREKFERLVQAEIPNPALVYVLDLKARMAVSRGHGERGSVPMESPPPLMLGETVPNPIAEYVSEVLRMQGSDFDRAQSELQVSREQLNWLVSEEVENPRSQFVREEVLSKDQLKRIEANLDLSLSAEQVSRLLRIGQEDPAVGYLTSNLIGPRQSRALRLGEDVVVPTEALAPLLSPRLKNPNAKYVTELLGVQEVARLISSSSPPVLDSHQIQLLRQEVIRNPLFPYIEDLRSSTPALTRNDVATRPLPGRDM